MKIKEAIKTRPKPKPKPKHRETKAEVEAATVEALRQEKEKRGNHPTAIVRNRDTRPPIVEVERPDPNIPKPWKEKVFPSDTSPNRLREHKFRDEVPEPALPVERPPAQQVRKEFRGRAIITNPKDVS